MHLGSWRARFQQKKRGMANIPSGLCDILENKRAAHKRESDGLLGGSERMAPLQAFQISSKLMDEDAALLSYAIDIPKVRKINSELIRKMHFTPKGSKQYTVSKTKGGFCLQLTRKG